MTNLDQGKRSAHQAQKDLRAQHIGTPPAHRCAPGAVPADGGGIAGIDNCRIITVLQNIPGRSRQSQKLPDTGHPISGLLRKENRAGGEIHTLIANMAPIGGVALVGENTGYGSILCHTGHRDGRI